MSSKIALLSALGLSVGVCASLAAGTAHAEPAVIYDMGGKFDKSFNQAGFDGAERWKKETGKPYLEFEISNPTQREQAKRRMAQRGATPIVAIGFSMGSTMERVARDFPKLQFAIIDAVVDLPNVQSITFKEHEGSFLVGVMAAMASKTGKVGFIGGMDIPLIRRFQCGFEQGAKYANPKIAVSGNMTGTQPTAWNDPARGAELAKAQFASGVDVVFAAAGGTGMGVYQAAKDNVPDYRSLGVLAADRPTDDPGPLDLRGLFADVLQIDPATIDPDQSFVDLGGNSLSYVAMSVRLERAIGHLPADWQRLPLSDLESVARPRRWWGTTLETSVALRAVAIVLVVGSHAGSYTLWGGAHILLGIVGYNFGRFCLTPLPRAERVRHLRTTIGWIAVPSVLWVAFVLVVTDHYAASNLLLANKFLGPDDSMTAGRLWFVEVVVWTLVALALVCWAPIGDRLERRRPFVFALAFLAVGLAIRFDGFGLGIEGGHDGWFTVLAFWFFAIGWAASKASTTWQRAAVTVLLAIGVVGYFGDPNRELLVFAGLALLIWLPAIRCPSAFTVVAGVLAEASLFIYLTHYQVYPLFGEHVLVGVIASIIVGILLTQLVSTARRRMRLRGPRPLRPAEVPARR